MLIWLNDPSCLDPPKRTIRKLGEANGSHAFDNLDPYSTCLGRIVTCFLTNILANGIVEFENPEKAREASGSQNSLFSEDSEWVSFVETVHCELKNCSKPYD